MSEFTTITVEYQLKPEQVERVKYLAAEDAKLFDREAATVEGYFQSMMQTGSWNDIDKKLDDWEFLTENTRRNKQHQNPPSSDNPPPAQIFGEFENVRLTEIELSGLYNNRWDKDTVDAAIEWLSQYKKSPPPGKLFTKDGDYAYIKRVAIPAVIEQQSRIKSKPNAHTPSSQPRNSKHYNTAAPAVGERERRAVEEISKFREGAPC